MEKNKFHSLLPLSQYIKIGVKKSLGQNFILDLNITDKIVNLSNVEEKNGDFLEIGPGLGPLTMSILNLCSKMNKLYVIEKDSRFIEHLNTIKKIDERLEIINGDCMNYKIPNSITHIIANLAYNISVPFIMNCLQNQDLKTMTVLVQKEVGERFVAQIKTKAYGKVSVLAQLFSEVKIVYSLGPKIFTPPPKVDSVLLFFQLKNRNLLHLWSTLEHILHTCFHQRRKMLSNTLGKMIENFMENYPQIYKSRPEELKPQDFLSLVKSSTR